MRDILNKTLHTREGQNSESRTKENKLKLRKKKGRKYRGKKHKRHVLVKKIYVREIEILEGEGGNNGAGECLKENYSSVSLRNISWRVTICIFCIHVSLKI